MPAAPRPLSANLLNYAFYQTGWLAVVFSVANGRPAPGSVVALTLLAVHIFVARARLAELRLAMAAGAMGFVVDSAQVALGLIAFPAGMLVPWLCPPWIVVMWMQFATTFRFSLRWLLTSTSRAALAGAVGGPLAYSVGERLGAIDLRDPLPATLGVMSALWLVAVPALARMADTSRPGAYRL